MLRSKTAIAILCILLQLLGCGSSEKQQPSNEQLTSLVSEVSKFNTHLPFCTIDGISYPSKPNCNNGDMVLFNGLLCLSNPQEELERACAYVKNSQGESGRWYRSPEHKDEMDSFSRDMALGVLAYSLATGEHEGLRRWRTYVDAADGSYCPVSSDGRCSDSANIATLSALILGEKKELSSYKGTLYTSARFGPVGFPLHLTAVQVLMLERLGRGDNTFMPKIKLAIRQRQPLNPFFLYVIGETGLAAGVALEELKAVKPGVRPIGDQWSFERETEEKAWLRSMGWEYVTLVNFLKG